MPTKYDLAIIGSGGGAFAAAIRATTLSKSVLMIERGTLGGTCVNSGCVPSKTLIAAAEARHSAADATDRFPGITTTTEPVDMAALIDGKQSLVESLRSEKYADVADSYGWAVRRGDAAFAGTPDAPVLQVAGDDGSTETIQAEHYLVATGSRPWAPPIDGLDEAGYLTSTTAMELTEVPGSLLVLGGGYVALEQAQ
ncbi:FAD-dependent oxidoreductase, partial [uncultured Aeromicrobium sp.]